MVLKENFSVKRILGLCLLSFLQYQHVVPFLAAIISFKKSAVGLIVACLKVMCVSLLLLEFLYAFSF